MYAVEISYGVAVVTGEASESVLCGLEYKVAIQ